MIRFVSLLSKLFPTLLATIFYLTDFVTQVISGFLTSVLYNTRIAHRWRNLEYNYADGSGESYSVHQKVVRLMKSQVEYDRLSEVVLPSTLMTAVGATQIRNDELDSLISGGPIFSSIIDAAAENIPNRFIYFNCALTHLLVNNPHKFSLLKDVQWFNDPQFFIFPFTNNRSDFVSGDWSLLVCDMKGKESIHFDPFEKNKRIAVGVSNLLGLEVSNFSFQSLFASNPLPISESGLFCIKVLENLQRMPNARAIIELQSIDLKIDQPREYRIQIDALYRSLSAKNKIKRSVQELNTRFIHLLAPGFGEDRSLDASALVNKAKKIFDKSSGETKNRASHILRRLSFLFSFSLHCFSLSHTPFSSFFSRTGGRAQDLGFPGCHFFIFFIFFFIFIFIFVFPSLIHISFRSYNGIPRLFCRVFSFSKLKPCLLQEQREAIQEAWRLTMGDVIGE